MVVTPGPGREATPSTATLLVAGMQNAVARTEACGIPSVRSPARVPLTAIRFAECDTSVQVSLGPQVPHAGATQSVSVTQHCAEVTEQRLHWPKAPGVRWSGGQKIPSSAMRTVGSVVKGFKVTGSGAWNAPPPISGGQSMLVVDEVVVVHGAPSCGP